MTATTIASDADGDPLTLTYDWNVNGQIVQSGSLNTLDGSQINTFDKNDVVSVSRNGQRWTHIKQSKQFRHLTIQNTRPTVANISLSPSNPAAGDAIQCVLDTPSTDEDGDSITYTIDWTVEVKSIPEWNNHERFPMTPFQQASHKVQNSGNVRSHPMMARTNGPSSSAMTETCDVILNFNGGYDYITLDPLTSMPNDKTMEAWVRLDSPPTGTVQLMSSQAARRLDESTEISVGIINGCAGANSGCKSGYTNAHAWINNNRPGNDGGFLYAGWDGSWKHIAITITSNGEPMHTLHRRCVVRFSPIVSGWMYERNHDRHYRSTQRIRWFTWRAISRRVRMSSAIEYSGGFTPQYPLPVTNNTELLYGLQNDYGLSTVSDDSGNGINGTLNGTILGFGWSKLSLRKSTPDG